jgi:hypothetical protein
MTWPQAVRLGSALPPHDDTYFTIWRLSWVAYQIVRDPVHLFDGNIFYPERWTLAYSDAMLLPALVAAPLAWIGLPQVTTYNLVLLAAFITSGIAMFVLVRSLTSNTTASLLAGLVYAFSPYRFIHYEHLELQVALWMPLALWRLHAFIAEPRWRDALLVGLFTSAQVMSSLYYGAFFTTYLAVVLPVLIVGLKIRHVARLATGLALCILLAAPYLVPYIEARRIVGVRTEENVLTYAADPINYLATPGTNRLYGWTFAPYGFNERTLFPGLVVLALTTVSLWPPVSRRAVAYALALIFAVLMSFGLDAPPYRWMYEHVWAWSAFRVPARYGMLTTLSFAILSGLGLARLSTLASRTRLALPAAVTILSMVEFWSPPNLVPARGVSAVNRWLKLQPRTVIFELPVTNPERMDVQWDAAYMFQSTFHWQTLANGYSGFYPPSYVELLDRMRSFPSPESLDLLRQRDVSLVLVHGESFDPAQFVALTEKLAASPELSLLFRVPGGTGPTLVLRLHKARSGGGQ